MNSIDEIREISETRLKEAKVLYDEGYFDGCVYLAGYTVELLLKARIAQLLNVPNLFVSIGKEKIKVFRIHDLKDLALYAGLHRSIAEEKNGTFKEYWSLIYSQWSENLRYNKIGTCNESSAKSFLIAIESPSNGVKQWIEKRLIK